VITLITGASTGLGRNIAEALAADGQIVFASMREVHGRNAANAADLSGIPGVMVVELDVTSETSTQAAVDQVLTHSGQIDCVVNNAGFGSFGLAEAFTPEQWHAILDTNLMGSVRVNRAVLPSMRGRGSGLLIHISSIAGRLPVPYLGPYCATKWALECYAEQLRLELAPLGVDSVVIEPGKFQTEIYSKRFSPERYAEMSAAYGEGDLSLRFMAKFVGDMQTEAQDPAEVGSAVRELVRMDFGSRPFRTPVGADAEWLSRSNGVADDVRCQMSALLGLPELTEQKRKTGGSATQA